VAIAQCRAVLSAKFCSDRPQTPNTRIAQQVGTSFGIAIVAVALQSLLAHGATNAFQGAFWWTIGITGAALIPALVLPAARAAEGD
jgi:predicted cobalt transporter CbtA